MNRLILAIGGEDERRRTLVSKLAEACERDRISGVKLVEGVTAQDILEPCKNLFHEGHVEATLFYLISKSLLSPRRKFSEAKLRDWIQIFKRNVFADSGSREFANMIDLTV